MRYPSLDRACEKFVTAVAKNAPRTETNLDAEQIVALCQSVLRPRIEKMCAEGFRIETFAEAKERRRIERKEVMKMGKKCGGKSCKGGGKGCK